MQNASVRNYSADGGYHTYSFEERRGFANYINELLGNDPELKGILPLNPDSEDLFIACSKGLLLSKLVNAIKPGTVTENKINKSKTPNAFIINQNNSLAIDGLKDLGCKVVSIGPEDITSGTPHLILGLVWQAVKIGLLEKVNLRAHPELVALMEENEDISRFMNLAPETNLLRWFNFHLKRAGHPRQVRNFTGDISDAENYLVLLEQIAPNVVPRGAHFEKDPRRRAEMVCHYANQLGCGSFVTPKDILDGNEKLNLAFTAYLFNKLPGLEVIDDNMVQQEALKEAERLLKQKYEEEETKRRARWQAQEEIRRSEWENEEEQRRLQWEAKERAARDKIAEEEAKMRAQLDAETRALREKQNKEDEERRKKQREAEEAARRLEEEKRRFEVEREQARLMEEERRRQFEAEMRLKEARRREEEEKRREEDQRRAEEERRRMFEEEERRKEEEERMKFEEEMARQAAWADYYRKQEIAAAAAEEERRRQSAWADYYRQLEEKKRAEEAAAVAAALAAEEERRRHAAWQKFQTDQANILATQQAAAMAAQQQAAALAAQQQAAMIAQQQAEQAAAALAAQQQAAALHAQQQAAALQAQQQAAFVAQQQALMAKQQAEQAHILATQQQHAALVAQQQAMATTTTVYQPVVTNVTKTTTTIKAPPKWPIPRLVITVVRAQRLAKKDKFSKADPYVVLVHGTRRVKTDYIKNTQDPVFNQDFEFRNVHEADYILVQIWDKDTFKKDDFMGEVKLTAKDFVNGQESWHSLASREARYDKVHGDILLRFACIYS